MYTLEKMKGKSYSQRFTAKFSRCCARMQTPGRYRVKKDGKIVLKVVV